MISPLNKELMNLKNKMLFVTEVKDGDYGQMVYTDLYEGWILNSALDLKERNEND